MHTSVFYDDTSRGTKEAKAVIHHNGDYSGVVHIQLHSSWKDNTQTHLQLDSDGFWNVEIPFELMEFLVAEKIRSARISQLEDMSASELLGSNS